MAAPRPLRTPSLALAALAALAALLLALFDWRVAVALIGSLVVGWALVLAGDLGAAVYRRHRMAVIGVAAVVLLVLAALFRPDGRAAEEAREPMPVSGYAAEVWPNRLAGQGTFILRERVDLGTGDGADGRANLEPIATGPLMRELRFAPGAGAGLPSIRLIEDGAATIVVNPIEAGEVHHARGGSVSRVDLPIGPVVRIELHELPAEARVAYLVGAGRALSPIASLVTPLRRMHRTLAMVLFALVGALAAWAWSDRLIGPLRRRFTERPQPNAPRGPGDLPRAPTERAPLVPRPR